jgi:hypothetical protein
MGCIFSSDPRQPIVVNNTTGSAPKVIGYFTDVEGNWQYFERCLAFSSVLQVFLSYRIFRSAFFHSRANTVE